MIRIHSSSENYEKNFKNNHILRGLNHFIAILKVYIIKWTEKRPNFSSSNN